MRQPLIIGLVCRPIVRLEKFQFFERLIFSNFYSVVTLEISGFRPRVIKIRRAYEDFFNAAKKYSPLRSKTTMQSAEGETCVAPIFEYLELLAAFFQLCWRR